MLVFVINKHGEALMPCKPRKAKQKKARIIKYDPFTI
ncbi:RRXRR domain-containing protein [Virgibacillus pantothenticus]|nr:RRXRR domain-containing protein [Virgibacillus pantothenticus]